MYKEINDEFEIKRKRAIRLADRKKEDIYNKIPKIQELENMIKRNAIETSRKILDMNEKDAAKQKIILQKEIANLRKKINETLYKNGYSPEELEPEFECSICQDNGYVIEQEQRLMCSCYKKRLIKEKLKLSNLENIQGHTFDTFKLEYYSDFSSGDGTNSLSPRDNMMKIKKHSEEFVKRFSYSEQKNILFTGKTGLGKTFLSNCIANELVKNGYSVFYQTASNLMVKILNYRFKSDISEETAKFMNEIKEADLLIIDDLGTEAGGEYRGEELFEIIDGRIKQNKKMLISTNLSLGELQAKYGERITSRIIGEFSCYMFKGEDIRILKRKLNI